jgi:hypothetical protein
VQRRAYLAAVGASVPAFAGCTTLAESSNQSRADYRGEQEVVYEHDDLTLRLRQAEVTLGDTVEFEVTNTGSSAIVLGCQNPWAIQQRSDDGWRHVAWTGERYYQMCATELGAGESLVEEVTLSESEFDRGDEAHVELAPGEHRFLLLGSSPFVALDFEITDAE